MKPPPSVPSLPFVSSTPRPARCLSSPGPAVPCILTALALTAACRNTEKAPEPLDLQTAERVLAAQTRCWNQGDLEGFVETYREGPELTFLGADGLTRGRADLLARYREGYPDAASRGTLSFEVLEFRPLGHDHALLLGRYRLQREEPASGYFSLVLERTEDGLLILHDHSSAAPGGG